MVLNWVFGFKLGLCVCVRVRTFEVLILFWHLSTAMVVMKIVELDFGGNDGRMVLDGSGQWW